MKGEERADAHADERREDIGAFGRTEDIAVDELPAAFFDGVDSLFFGLG